MLFFYLTVYLIRISFSNDICLHQHRWCNHFHFLFKKNQTGGGNDELKADAGKLIKSLKLSEHGFVSSNV